MNVAMRTQTIHLHDDGCVPNNPSLPLIIYEDVFAAGSGTDVAIAQFAENGWSGAWVNGIFDFHHYHARSHEVLANLGPTVTVQFGGAAGPTVDFRNGAVVLIPAGGGHCRKSSGAGLVIVGAYPTGQEDWDLKRADNTGDYQRAKLEIERVALPAKDPVTGDIGPMLEHWHT